MLPLRRDDSNVTPDLGHLPRPALPVGAKAVVFSPLLDERALITIRDMGRRCPGASVAANLALRLGVGVRDS